MRTLALFALLLTGCPWLGIGVVSESVHHDSASHDHCGVTSVRCDSNNCWCRHCGGWCPVPFGDKQ